MTAKAGRLWRRHDRIAAEQGDAPHHRSRQVAEGRADATGIQHGVAWRGEKFATDFAAWKGVFLHQCHAPAARRQQPRRRGAARARADHNGVKAHGAPPQRGG